MKKHILAGLSLKKRLPILQWLPQYTLSIFFQDILAGLTVGMTEIPQGIAYAVVAGLPPEYGLYSGLLDGFIYAVLGGCKDLNIGPTSLLSLMLQPHVTKFGTAGAVLITFISGIIILIFGIIQLGFLIDFFSFPIIAGFICASSFNIASSQLKNIFGIPGKTETFLESWRSIFQYIHEARLWDTVLGLCCVVFLVALKEIKRYGTLQRRPDWSTFRNTIGIVIFLLSLARNALIVVIGTAIAYYLREDLPFKITGEVSGGFPHFKVPEFSAIHNGTVYNFGDLLEGFGASIIFIPLISILEAISIAKAFAKGKKLDATQEMFALGICNTVGSFIGSMPVTGSFTRSAVNNASGVKTTLAGVITSILLILSIAFLTPSFYYVPKSTLGAVIICAMIYLFDWGAFAVIWRTNKLDYVPFLVTFLCSLFVGIEYGILIGVCVNLLFVLYASARPKLNIEYEQNAHQQTISIQITPKDTLYFPAGEYLRDTILDCDEKLLVIINGKYMRNMDVTVAKILKTLYHEMQNREQKLLLTNFKQDIIDICIGLDKNLKTLFYSEEDLKTFIKDDRHIT